MKRSLAAAVQASARRDADPIALPDYPGAGVLEIIRCLTQPGITAA
ncbi:hypothetical protein [Acrocarpospora catenulata]|nr:hypothetical protein [Acrocarpospora catenulata]